MESEKLKPLLSSESDEWETPDDLFQFLNQTFHFTVDVCATIENAKLPRFYTMTRDGLTQSWDGVAWCNPPYTNHQARAWIEKGLTEVRQNPRCERIVYLIPVRTDTKLWHRIIMRRAATITFLEGRLSFKRPDRDHPNPAPFPSCLITIEKLTLAASEFAPLQPAYGSLKKNQYRDPGQTRLVLNKEALQHT